MVRRWIYEADRRDREYFDGVVSFVRAARTYKSNERTDYICCPCVDCKNQKKWQNIEQIRTHLLRKGFMPGYTCWTELGEDDTTQEGQNSEGAEDETVQEW